MDKMVVAEHAVRLIAKAVQQIEQTVNRSITALCETCMQIAQTQTEPVFGELNERLYRVKNKIFGICAELRLTDEKLQKIARIVADKSIDQKTFSLATASGGTNGMIAAMLHENAVLTDADLAATPATDEQSLPSKRDLSAYDNVAKAFAFSEQVYYKESIEAKQSLDARGRRAIYIYTDEGYSKINKYLRGQPVSFSTTRAKENAITVINEMSKALDSRCLSQDTVLYRGVSAPHVVLGKNWRTDSLEELRAKLIGTIFVDDGFCSTSITPRTANMFSASTEGLLIRIDAPRGANAICVREISAYADEMEVLLHRGSGFEITAIEPSSEYGSGYEVHVRLVGRRRTYDRE